MISKKTISKDKVNIAIIGARKDGQAGVVLDALSYNDKINIVAFFDHTPEKIGKKIDGIPIVAGHSEILEFNNFEIDAVHVAIGDNKARYEIYNELKSLGFQLLTIIHPSSIISASATIGEGCFIGVNAVIQNNSFIGDYSLINTSAVIEHDNSIGKAVHMAPNTCTAGRVKINDLAFIGIGSVIIPDINIGYSAFVNAGSIVKRDVKDYSRHERYGKNNNIYDRLG